MTRALGAASSLSIWAPFFAAATSASAFASAASFRASAASAREASLAGDNSAGAGAARPGTSTLVIPGAVTASDSAYQLELHLRALHRSGVTLRRLGHATRPLVLEVGAGHPTRPRSVVKQWWFWTGVVTLVAAAVAIPVIVTQSRDVGPQVIVSRWQR